MLVCIFRNTAILKRLCFSISIVRFGNTILGIITEATSNLLVQCNVALDILTLIALILVGTVLPASLDPKPQPRPPPQPDDVPY